MSIVSSIYILDDHVQTDGTIWVTEHHTDSGGGVHQHSYQAPPGSVAAFFEARLSASAAWIEGRLAELEAERLLNG